MATPLILTALSCWNRLSERGSVLLRREATVLSGISCPFGPVT